jgi:uncharacterized membrane protein
VLRPALAFAALSLFFGSLVIVVTPPLRGPDETAHFLRAYGIARGQIVPSLRDTQNRKGLVLPPRLFEGFAVFENARVSEKQAGFSYRAVFEAYVSRPPSVVDQVPRFVPYAGSEGYSPIAYLPHSAAALIAEALDLGFLPTLYLMRFAGLAALTAVIAWTIAIVPNLSWAFVAIAMLPAAFYGRSVISADGTALTAAMTIAALWMRGILAPETVAPGRRSLWMALGALTKAPNVAFVLLELRQLKPNRWRTLALTTLPAIAASAAWTLASGADTAAWRMVEITGLDASAFDASAKLLQLVDDPSRFPMAVIGAWCEYGIGELWRQLIGVLGLFDTVLLGWVYPVLSVLLASTFITALPLAPADRTSAPIAAAAAALAYCIIVYLISYLVFTPRGATTVWGVQGRYFIPILPLVAFIVAAALKRGLIDRLSAASAVLLAVLSGCASVEAIVRTDRILG